MYGICNMSVVPVRAADNERSEMVTQMLFGDVYSVVNENEHGKWIKIKLHFDEYEGWISQNMYHSISESDMSTYSSAPHGICYDDVALVESKAASHLILLGSTLPVIQGRNILIGNTTYTYEGDLIDIPKKITPDIINFTCMRYMHAPYFWGGKTLFGTDCSGFVQIVYKLLGYQIKRDAYQQAMCGKDIKNIADINVGDLAFFENEEKRITHVGIILEYNHIIHAHGRVRIDILDDTGIINIENKQYSHKLSKIKRIIE
ncbi:MAG: C40 family peptidase [Cytophagales bacterium]|nr:C40 family peptidase [Cytophagales bacterium]